MSHAPVLIPDYTLFIQLGIFFGCYFVMKGFVFGPYLGLLAVRRAKTIGLREKALQARERTAKLQVDYEAHMKAERKKVAGWIEEERRRISDEERNAVQAVRDVVTKKLQLLRENVQTDVNRARRDLLPLVNEYSSQIASKLVGHPVHVSTLSAPKEHAEAEQVVPQ